MVRKEKVYNYSPIIITGIIFFLMFGLNSIFFMPLSLLGIDYSPSDFELNIDKTNIGFGESINISWSDSNNANYYALYQHNSNIFAVNSCILIENHLENNSYIISNLDFNNYYFRVVAINDYGYTLSNEVNVSVNRWIFTEIPDNTYFSYSSFNYMNNILQGYSYFTFIFNNLNATHYIMNADSLNYYPNATLESEVIDIMYINKSSREITNCISTAPLDTSFQNNTHAFILAPRNLELNETYIAYNLWESADHNYITTNFINYAVNNQIIYEASQSFNASITFFDLGEQISIQYHDTKFSGILLRLFVVLAVPILEAYIMLDISLINTNFNWNNWI